MVRVRLVCLILAAAACAVLMSCPLGAAKLAHVSFKANGSPVTLVHGDIPYLGYEYAFAYGGISSVKLLLHVEASEEDNNNHYLRFYFPGTTVGTYSGDGLDVDYATNYAGDERYDKLDFTVTVSRLGAVDGFIEGTFSGTVHDDLLGTIVITDGGFRVVRVE